MWWKLMVVEDRGINDTGSDHNVIWCLFKLGALKEEKRNERFKWRVDGRSRWEEFQEAVEEEFKGWEIWVRDLESKAVGEELSERVWEEWKMRVLAAAERGIGKKKISKLYKGWWSVDVERVIQERREACQQLRQAKRRGDEVASLWETYRLKRKKVKKVIRKEKKENRQRTLQRIMEQGGPSCKLFWSDLQGKKKSKKIARMRGKECIAVEETEQVLEMLAKQWN